jgi:hypothetical protein
MSISASLTTVAPALAAGRYIAFEAVYCGALGEGERLLAPLAKLGKPLFDNITAKTYLAAQLGLSGASPAPLPPGLSVYVKSGFLRTLPDTLIDVSLQHFEPPRPGSPSLGSVSLVEPCHACSRRRPRIGIVSPSTSC